MLALGALLFKAVGDVGNAYGGDPAVMDNEEKAFKSDEHSILFSNRVDLANIHGFHLLVHLGCPTSVDACACSPYLT